MNNEKLAEIGSRLDVSETDMDGIRKRYRLTKIIAPIVGGLVAIFSAIFGYMAGNNDAGTDAANDAGAILVNSETGEVYPYMIPVFLGVVGGMSASGLRRRTKLVIIASMILTAILTILGYMLAHGMAYDNVYDAARGIEYYSGAIDYGVYSKEK